MARRTLSRSTTASANLFRAPVASNDVNLNKTGLGTIAISGVDTLTGNTAVNQGQLLLNGTATMAAVTNSVQTITFGGGAPNVVTGGSFQLIFNGQTTGQITYNTVGGTPEQIETTQAEFIQSASGHLVEHRRARISPADRARARRRAYLPAAPCPNVIVTPLNSKRCVGGHQLSLPTSSRLKARWAKLAQNVMTTISNLTGHDSHRRGRVDCHRRRQEHHDRQPGATATLGTLIVDNSARQ